MTFILSLLFLSNTLSPENVLKFADYLYLEGNHQSALNEYRRYIFLSDSLKEEVYEKIIDCLIKLKRFEEALKETEKLGDDTKKDYTKGLLYFLSGEYETARRHLMKTELSYQTDVRRLLGLSYAYEFRFSDAGNFIKLPTPPPRYKSPLLGGIFSILPGGGHFYCGRFGDGIYSSLVVGTASLLSYYYYNRDEDLKFSLSIFATVLFYTANIYGGINSARNYNYYQNQNYLQKIVESNQ